MQVKQIGRENSKTEENNKSVYYSKACRKQQDANLYNKDYKRKQKK